jgi:hypothetical protein
LQSGLLALNCDPPYHGVSEFIAKAAAKEYEYAPIPEALRNIFPTFLQEAF